MADLEERYVCPCCHGELDPTYDDALCWECGLYPNDDPTECDADHEAELD
jgi:predicted amidophosphoribosyltransferase